jgi:exosortase O
LRVFAAALLVAVVVPLLPWWLARTAHAEAWTGVLLSITGIGLAVVAPSTTASSRRIGLVAAAGLALVGAGLLVDVRTVQAAGVVAVAFALVGFVGARRSLSLPGLGLLWLGLPLSGDIDVVGFPLRQASAALAAIALRDGGVVTAATETVLVAENGVADVEAPCAGLATIRLLVAAVLVVAALRHTPLRRLGAALVVAVVLAVLGNAARVAVLAALVLVAGRTDLAALLHVPLGVVVFLVSAAAAVPLLSPGRRRSTPGVTGPSSARVPIGCDVLVGPSTLPTTLPTAVLAFVGVVAVVVVGLLVVGRARPATGAPDDARLAAALDDVVDGGSAGPSVRLPLSFAEEQLFAHHAVAAGKRRLPVALGGGEVLFVVSRSLRALHAPERCLAGSGHGVVDVDVVERGGVRVKRLLLDGGRNVGLSMLRSPSTTAATLGDVVAARLRGDRGPWVFVSAVVRNDVELDEEPIVRALVDDAARVLVPATSLSSSAAASAGDS